MHPLEKEVRRLLVGQKLIRAGGEKIIVAVSGGPDSISLLHVLANLAAPLNLTLVAAYVNHGLRSEEEVDKEAALVKDQADKLGAAYEIGKADVKGYAHNQKLSIEHAGRVIRYKFLDEIADTYQAHKIALAHTADDQAEEILLRLIRGTGRSGLSGMKTIRQEKYIRPLLTIPKSRLLEYLATIKADYIDDSTNRERIYLRNRIRLDLIPYLTREFNPNIRRTLLQAAEILRDEEELLADLTDKACAAILTRTAAVSATGLIETILKDLELDLAKFTAQPKAIQRRVLEAACWQMQCRPQARQIKQLLGLINKDGSGGMLHLTNGLRVQKFSKQLLFSYPAGKTARRGNLILEKNTYFEARINGPGKWYVEQIGLTVALDCQDILLTEIKKHTHQVEYLDHNMITFPLTVRSPRPGDRFHPLGGKGRKKVGDFLIDQKVPLEERRQVPVLLSGDTIVALLGLRIDHRFRITKKTTKALRVKWQQKKRGRDGQGCG